MRNFEKESKEVLNKTEYIKQVIKQVLDYAEAHSYMSKSEDYTAFGQTYTDYLFKEKELDLERYILTIDTVVPAFNGQTWAKFKLFLENLFVLPKENKKSKTKTEQLTTRQKLLLCEELGILKLFDTDEELRNLANTDRALILSYLFGNDGAENIRKDLSDLSKIETADNLDVLEQIFDNLGLDNRLHSINIKKKR